MKTFREWLRESEGEESYKEFFTKKCEKYGVKSPSELSEEDKKKFFTEIKKEWTGEKEVNEKLEVSEGDRESSIFIDKNISKDFKIEVFDMDDIVNVTFKGKVLFESDLSEFKKFIFDINANIKDL